MLKSFRKSRRGEKMSLVSRNTNTSATNSSLASDHDLSISNINLDLNLDGALSEVTSGHDDSVSSRSTVDNSYYGREYDQSIEEYSMDYNSDEPYEEEPKTPQRLNISQLPPPSNPHTHTNKSKRFPLQNVSNDSSIVSMNTTTTTAAKHLSFNNTSLDNNSKNSISIEMSGTVKSKRTVRPKPKMQRKAKQQPPTTLSDCKKRTFHDDYEINKKRYEQWKGKHKFFFGGRVMVGSNTGQLSLTLGLIVASWAIFFVLIYPASPSLLGHEMTLPASILLSVAMVLTLARSVILEPGIIPHRVPSSLIDKMSLEVKEKMEYCVTCNIIRPPRTKHCRQLNCCIKRFDHHCPWTGNSVGERNYFSFLAFITFTTLSTIFNAVTATDIARKGFEDGDLVKEIVCPIFVVWNVFVGSLVGSLLSFHMMLLYRGMTTNEYFRGRKEKIVSKWHVRDVFCKPLIKSELPKMNEYPGMDDESKDVEAAGMALLALQKALAPDSNNNDDSVV